MTCFLAPGNAFSDTSDEFQFPGWNQEDSAGPEVRNLPRQIFVGKQGLENSSLASLTGISGQVGKAGLSRQLGTVRNRLTMALPNRDLFLFTWSLEPGKLLALAWSDDQITGFVDLLAFPQVKHGC